MADDSIQIPAAAKALLDKYMSKIRIQGVMLINSTMSRSQLLDDEPDAHLIVMGNHEIGVETNWDIKSWRTSAKVSVRGYKQESGEEINGFDLNADYRVQYSVQEFEDSQKHFETLALVFAATNSIMHVWPFWREHVLSSTGKMGMNPILAPLFVKSNVLLGKIPGPIGSETHKEGVSKKAPKRPKK